MSSSLWRAEWRLLLACATAFALLLCGALVTSLVSARQKAVVSSAMQRLTDSALTLVRLFSS